MSAPLGWGAEPWGTGYWGSIVPLPVGGELAVAVFHIDPTTGVYTPLPDVATLEVSPQRNAPGALSLQYPVDGRSFDLLRSIAEADVDVEVAIWLHGRDAESMRGLLGEASGDQADPDATWTFSGTFLEGRPAEGLVGINSATPTKQTPFANATAGTILRTLMQRCQTRGELTDITFATFSNTLDSAGAAWALQASPTFGPKDSVLDVLDALVEAGMCEWQITPDHKLRVYNAGTLGADRTVGANPVVVWAGSNIVDGPHKHSVRQSATHLLVEGAGGLYVEVSDPTALARRGRRITKVVSAGNIGDAASLTAYGQAQLQVLAHGKKELTHGLKFDTDAPLPLTDFTVGDWIYSGTERGLYRRRVEQWVLSLRAGEAPDGSLTLNDVFAAADVTLQRRIDALERGKSIVGTSTASGENDTVPPAAPGGVVATSAAYIDTVSGAPLAQVSTSWAAVTANADGTAIDDLSSYAVQWQFAQYGYPDGWQAAGTSQGPFLAFSGLPQHVQIQVRVAAVDWRGNRSAWSAAATVTTESDSTPPPTPAAPSAWNQQGVVVVAWNGLGAAGEAMPGDFDHVTIHKSTAASFTATTANRVPLELRGPGTVTYQPAPAELDTTLYFVLVAWDQLGNHSGQSAVASVVPHVPAAQVSQDLIDQALLNSNVDWSQAISPESIRTQHLSIAAFGDSEVPNGGFEDADVADPTLPGRWLLVGTGVGNAVVSLDTTAANVQAGTRAAKVALVAGAVRHVELRSPWIPTKPGEVWYIEATAKADRAHAGLSIVIDYSSDVAPDDAGSNVPLVLNTAFTTSYGHSEFQAAAPPTVGSAATRWIRFKVETRNNDSAALTAWFDEVRARKVLGRAEIGNAAIGAAQIGFAEITNANIANVSAGKVTSGTGTFSMLMATGNVRSADSGQRWILDPAGFRLYNSAGTNTVDLNANGSAYLSGSFTAGTGNDKVVVQPAGLGSSGISGVAEITFFANPTAPAYMNAVGLTGGRTLLGLNSGSSADSGTTRYQSTLILQPQAFQLFVNTAPGDAAGPNDRRGGYLGATQTAIELGVTQSTSTTRRAHVFLNGDDAFLHGPANVIIESVDASDNRDGGYVWLRPDTGDTLIGKYVSGSVDYFLRFSSTGGVDMYGPNGSRLSLEPSGEAILGASNNNFVHVTPSTAEIVANGFVKSFIIDHPGDPDRYLVHACTESPQNGVEYWGVATIADNWATVRLPDYFESLTGIDGRVALLTTVLDEDAPALRNAVASPVHDGRFRILCLGPDGTRVAWLVKAVRRDVPELVVEPRRDKITVRGDGPYRYYIPKESAA